MFRLLIISRIKQKKQHLYRELSSLSLVRAVRRDWLRISELAHLCQVLWEYQNYNNDYRIFSVLTHIFNKVIDGINLSSLVTQYMIRQRITWLCIKIFDSDTADHSFFNLAIKYMDNVEEFTTEFVYSLLIRYEINYRCNPNGQYQWRMVNTRNILLQHFYSIRSNSKQDLVSSSFRTYNA